jgi:hypothetical protein
MGTTANNLTLFKSFFSDAVEKPTIRTVSAGPSKNMNRPIILFSPFIYPEPISTGRYNTHLVKALQLQGCHVEVVASFSTPNSGICASLRQAQG